MGNLITIGGGEKHDPVDLFLDFEKAQPQTDEERVIYDAIAQVLGAQIFSFFTDLSLPFLLSPSSLPFLSISLSPNLSFFFLRPTPSLLYSSLPLFASVFFFYLPHSPFPPFLLLLSFLFSFSPLFSSLSSPLPFSLPLPLFLSPPPPIPPLFSLFDHLPLSDRAPQILEKLTNYTGCEEHIRKAITNPGPETEDEVNYFLFFSFLFFFFVNVPKLRDSLFCDTFVCFFFFTRKGKLFLSRFLFLLSIFFLGFSPPLSLP